MNEQTTGEALGIIFVVLIKVAFFVLATTFIITHW